MFFSIKQKSYIRIVINPKKTQMKKTFLFIAVISAFASCKKDRTCTCSISEGGTTIKETITFHKVSDKTAKTDCTTLPISVIDSTGTATIVETCVLN